MATLLGAVAASHTPTIGFALDSNKQADPVWAPIFEVFEPPRRWLAEQKPDALVVIYNDHISSFFLDHYSAFSLGVGEQYPVADEGGGTRRLPPIAGHPQLAAHIGQSVMADAFDLSFFQGRALDHGAVLGISNLHIYAAMRGQSLAEFQQTRNAPGALYSVGTLHGDEAATAHTQPCSPTTARAPVHPTFPTSPEHTS